MAENERGMDVEFIHPTAFCVLKSPPKLQKAIICQCYFSSLRFFSTSSAVKWTTCASIVHVHTD